MEKEYSRKYLQINRGRNIVFDSSEVPFLKPSAELSDLSNSISIVEKFKTNWPNLTFRKASLVDGAVLIQDISPDTQLTQSAKKLNEVSNITLQVVDGKSLTQDILDLLRESGILNTNPLVIYPGYGAISLRNFLNDGSLNTNSIYLPTQRTMIRNGEFQLDVDYSSLPKNIDTQTVLMIDDVVASGQTAQTICREMKTRFPSIKCVLATWLFLKPTKPENKTSLSGIEGIDETIASVVLKGNLTSRPPINSLSCFLRSEDKYEEMKANFIKKYITDQQAFNEFIRSI